MVDVIARLSCARKVEELLEVLEKRRYIYPTLEPNVNIGKEVENREGEVTGLPVQDVLNIFCLYRPICNRIHKKNVSTRKMVYRSTGWQWKGSILHYEDEAIIWQMDDDRMTIDKIVASERFQKATLHPKTRKGGRIPPFLRRNVISTQKAYTTQQVTKVISNGIDFNSTETEILHTDLPKKRKLPVRKSTRKRRRTVQ